MSTLEHPNRTGRPRIEDTIIETKEVVQGRDARAVYRDTIGDDEYLRRNRADAARFDQKHPGRRKAQNKQSRMREKARKAAAIFAHASKFLTF